MMQVWIVIKLGAAVIKTQTKYAALYKRLTTLAVMQTKLISYHV